jgi:hypothetical protein
MKRFNSALFVPALIAACLACSFDASARTRKTYSPASTLRAAAVLTTADVYSTATVSAEGYDSEILYVTFTKGSLDSASVKVVVANDGNPASTGYYELNDSDLITSLTLVADGRWVIIVPKNKLAAAEYWGVACKGTGTVTNSVMGVTRRSYGEYVIP